MSEHVLILNKDAKWFAEQLSPICGGYVFHPAETYDEAKSFFDEAEILIGLAPFLRDELFLAMPKLKWVHALTTGVDNLLRSPALKHDVVLSNSNGFHGPQMSELAFLLMLSAARDYPRMIENQNNQNWERWPQPLLYGKTACILGLGVIAESMIARCNAFGMTVTGVSDGRKTMDGLAKIYTRAELPEAAAQCDYLIVLVPYAPATHHIIDDKVLTALGSQSVLINLARGGCVDEVALKKHLDAGAVKAAGIDVFETEPLPANDPLWKTQNALITPHIGGMSDIYHEQVLPVIIDNLKAWKSGGAEALPGHILRGE